MDNQQQKTEAQAMQEIVSTGLNAKTLEQGASPYLVVPESYNVVNLEEFLPEPTRKKGKVILHDVASFINFFNRHKTENSNIYCNQEKCTITAVFDDDGAVAGWKEHQATYEAPLSKEWEIWSQYSGNQQNQSNFAEFLENNLPDITSTSKDQPSAAQLLEVATNFKINKRVNFSSSKRLENGQVSFEYIEDIQGSGGAKGQIKVPEKFWIAIPIFKNGVFYELECRLKYRLKEGQLFIWYELYRAEKVRDIAFSHVQDKVQEGCAITLLNGEI